MVCSEGPVTQGLGELEPGGPKWPVGLGSHPGGPGDMITACGGLGAMEGPRVGSWFALKA